MSEIQDSILRHNFIQQIPKILTGKVNSIQEGSRNGKFEGNNKFNGKQGNIQDSGKGESEIIIDSDKNHAAWHIKQGEDFTKTFYKNQRQCPKTQGGKPICMKFFIRGFCDKSCTRAHKLNQEDEKHFEKFIFHCREGSSKPDF
jgi:hypothetical protein